MTLKELSSQLQDLSLGFVEFLSRSEFEVVFGSHPDMKAAAIALGEQHSCSVLFFGADDRFVAFTRKQSRAEVDRHY